MARGATVISDDSEFVDIIKAELGKEAVKCIEPRDHGQDLIQCVIKGLLGTHGVSDVRGNIVLLDRSLFPDGDTDFTTLKLLKESLGPHPPILILVTMDPDGEREHALAAGARHVLEVGFKRGIYVDLMESDLRYDYDKEAVREKLLQEVMSKTESRQKALLEEKRRTEDKAEERSHEARTWRRRFIISLVAGGVAWLFNLYRPASIDNLAGDWRALCVPGERKGNRVEFDLCIFNTSVTSLTGIEVVRLPPKDLISVEGLSKGMIFDKVESGKSQRLKFAVVVEDPSRLLERRQELRIWLAGGGRHVSEALSVDLGDGVLRHPTTYRHIAGPKVKPQT